jgi:hypothetical protein
MSHHNDTLDIRKLVLDPITVPPPSKCAYLGAEATNFFRVHKLDTTDIRFMIEAIKPVLNSHIHISVLPRSWH